MASDQLKGMLANLGPALSSMQMPQPQVTPYPVSGINQLLQGLSGGAQNFMNAKDAVEKERMKNLMDKIRYGPVAASAAQKLASGNVDLTPGEEAVLPMMGVDPNGIPLINRQERGQAARIQAGMDMSEFQKAQLKQQEKDLQFRRDEMQSNHDLKFQELQNQGKEIGLRGHYYDAMAANIADEHAARVSQFRESVAPQNDEQRRVWNTYYRDVYEGKKIDPKDQAVLDQIPGVHELTAEAAINRSARKEDEGLKLLEVAIANRVGAPDFNTAVAQGKVPQNILHSMFNLKTGNIAQRITAGDPTIMGSNDAVRNFLGVDSAKWGGLFGTSYDANTNAPVANPAAQAAASAAAQTPGAGLPGLEKPDMAAMNQEYESLKAKWQGNPAIPPDVAMRVQQLRQLLGR